MNLPILVARVALVAGLTLVGGCARPIGPRAFATGPSSNPKVINGHARDTALWDVEADQCFLVPEGAKITRGREGRVRVEMRKVLSFQGHPPRPMSPLTARRAMGCAWRVVDGCMAIGSFGEWGSPEGGAWVELEIQLPRGAVVHASTQLSGAASQAADPSSLAWLMALPQDPEYWYAAGRPAPGWTRLIEERP